MHLRNNISSYWVFILALLLPLIGFANTNIYIPFTGNDQTNWELEVVNHTEEDLNFELWSYYKSQKRIYTKNLWVEAGKTLTLSLAGKEAAKSWIKRGLKSPMGLSYRLKQKDRYLEIESKEPGNHWQWQGASSDILVSNLSSQENKISLLCYSADSKLSETKVFSVGAYEDLYWTPDSSCYKVEIQTQYRSLALKKDSSFWSYLASHKKNQIPSQKPYAYFVVGSLAKEDQDKSFVIRLSDSQQIAIARKAIQEPWNEEIPRVINGKIKKGHGLYNLNPNNHQQSFWSWHLEEVEFANVGAIWCNTNPQLIEDLLYSVEEGQDRACPWNFRIIGEYEP